MSYILNKTDGTILVDLIDGSVDTDTTSLTLVGRNYSGFGEFINENYIKLLENFSNSNSPANPLTGQLWWDTAEARLKVFNGARFQAAGGPFVQSTQPAMVAGDLWINSFTKQLNFYDGTTSYLAGPGYTNQQGKSGWITETVLDTLNRYRTILSLYVGTPETLTGTGTRVAVVSNIEFTPADGNTIPGIIGKIKKGINLIEPDSFIFRGIADRAVNLLRSDGSLTNADAFLSSVADSTTTGSIVIQNSNGIIIGPNDNQSLKIVGNSFVTENQRLDDDYKIRVKSSAAGSLIVDALTIDSSALKMGVFNGAPEYTLDVGGDLRVSGNLLVEGASSSFEVSTLRVLDKNIELALLDDSTEGDDTVANGAGIIVRSTSGSKDLLWQQSSSSWTSNQNFNLNSGRTYRINGSTVLSATALGSSVETATGLRLLGTLDTLDVGNTNIEGNTITTTGSGLQITSADHITITNNKKITGLAYATNNTDAASKIYVDEKVAGAAIAFALDVTGLNNTQVATIINDLVPASTVAEGTVARIHGTSIVGATVTGIDVGAVATIEYIAVDRAPGTQNEAVVRDIGFTDATGTVNVSITRTLTQYIVSSGAWIYDTDLVSSV
jgi:hypothetical protein